MTDSQTIVGRSANYRRLLALAARLWPDLISVEQNKQISAVRNVVQTLYLFPLALLLTVWLAISTDREAIQSQWKLLFLLFVLRYPLSQLSPFSNLRNDESYTKGSLARVVTWSGVLLFGPIALWLDVLGSLFDAGRAIWRLPPAGYAPRNIFWRTTNQLSTTLARDSLPSLLAIGLVTVVGNPTQWAAPTPETLGIAFIATVVKIGLTLFLMSPIVAVDIVLVGTQPGIASTVVSGIGLSRTMIRALVTYILVDLAGLLAAALFVLNGLSAYLYLTSTMLIVILLVHLLIKRLRLSQQQTRQMAKLEELGREIMLQPADDIDLPGLLQAYLPGIFEQYSLEIRLFPHNVLYRQGLETELIHDSVWESVKHLSGPYYWPTFESKEWAPNGALANPIISVANERVSGGLILLGTGDLADFHRQLSAVQSLASQIAASLHRAESFQAAITSRAEAYRKQVYDQVYQAELSAAYQRVTQELALAGTIQASFLPKELPFLPGWQLTVTLEPARETSGDYYDFISLPGGRIGLLIADVADKGIGPALYMALSRTLIRTFALEHDNEPASVLKAANERILADSDSDLFVTVFYGILDPHSGMLTYCNAGHNPPYLWQFQEENQIKALERTALPLGLFEDVDWQQNSVKVMPGDLLLAYTDGVTEAQDESQAFFGEERLKAIVNANLNRPVEIIEDKILAAIFDFIGDAPQFDDMALMTIARESQKER